MKERKLEKDIFLVGEQFYMKPELLVSQTNYGDTSMYIITGELINKSNKDYSYTSFDITSYDKNGKLIGKGNITVCNFMTGQTRTFDAIITMKTILIGNLGQFKIDYSTSGTIKS